MSDQFVVVCRDHGHREVSHVVGPFDRVQAQRELIAWARVASGIFSIVPMLTPEQPAPEVVERDCPADGCVLEEGHLDRTGLIHYRADGSRW